MKDCSSAKISAMARADGYKKWLIKRLRYVIDLKNKSVAAVEKEMGRSRGYLGDALRGEKRLSVESLLEVLDHLEIDPADFFSGKTAEEKLWANYPREGEATELADQVAETGEAPGRADTRGLVLAVIKVLQSKGLLDEAELLAELDQRRH